MFAARLKPCPDLSWRMYERRLLKSRENGERPLSLNKFDYRYDKESDHSPLSSERAKIAVSELEPLYMAVPREHARIRDCCDGGDL
jgi:hypothetical protein